MHEYSIVCALLDRVDTEAHQHDASSVHRIEIRVGEISGVEIDLLRTAYELARENTLCSGAELEVVSVPALWTCPRCDGSIQPGGVLRCAQCNIPARLTAGDEILLERIEMEVA